MALRNIRKEQDEILRKPSRKVELFDDRLQTLIDDMFETMYDAQGCGLAAVQVIVIDTEQPGEKLVLINPEIVETSGIQRTAEGCLSIPGKSGIVNRPMVVKVRALDREGKPFEKVGRGLLARAFCHEIDHLSGVLFVDKVEEWVEE